MMVKGEFVRGDGLVLPNNVTVAGTGWLLRGAFQADPKILRLGLCNAVYDQYLKVVDLDQPDATNGYGLQDVTPGLANWPTLAIVNNESYVQSKPIVFMATGTGFSKPVTRMFLESEGNVVALGSPLSEALQILATTPVALRTFSYRMYLR